MACECQIASLLSICYCVNPFLMTNSIYLLSTYHVSIACLLLGDPMDCSPPGSSVHGSLQARRLEWVAMPFSRGSSWPRDRIHVSYISCIAGRFSTTSAIWAAPSLCFPGPFSSPLFCFSLLFFSFPSSPLFSVLYLILSLGVVEFFL